MFSIFMELRFSLLGFQGDTYGKRPEPVRRPPCLATSLGARVVRLRHPILRAGSRIIVSLDSKINLPPGSPKAINANPRDIRTVGDLPAKIGTGPIHQRRPTYSETG